MDWLNNLFGIDLTIWEFLLFMLAGIATGVINTLAGSGSLITLPIFIFICGLPPTIANGTNRIGILVQTIVGVHEYKRIGADSFGSSEWLIIPALIGGVIGSLLAVDISDRVLNMTIGAIMVLMFFVLLLKPERWLREKSSDHSRNKTIISMVTFFLIGIYGGFIQASSGLIILAVLVLLNQYSLKAANGVKLLMVLVWTIPVLAIFVLNDQMHWGYGILMAVFQALGTWLGVSIIQRVPNANIWIHRLLVVIVAVAGIRFLYPLFF